MRNHRATIDLLTRIQDQREREHTEYEYTTVEREAVLNMRFRRGDHVRDTVTGQAGTVLAGYRRAVPKVQAP